MAADVMEIKRMYVPEHLRGQGIARVLLASMERQALSRGVHRLRLQTGSLQPEAIGLYESQGYRPVESWGKYANDPNAICYEKAIG